MKVAVLSGKGGTGKTTVSASLAASLSECQYLDCDVEEPNGAIFLNPKFETSMPVKVLVPKIDRAKCDLCGDCARACQFNAIAVVKTEVLLFHEICHHCGACVIACARDAITEVDRAIGVVEANADESFIQGKLDVGEPISIPIISEIKSRIKEDMPVVLDCSPGASCTVVESIEDCDYCILVTEPTPFGLHDLKIAVKLAQKMDLPFGVVLNKAVKGDRLIHDFCESEGIDLLMEIPYSRETAKCYSEGILPVENDDSLKEQFRNLYQKIEGGVSK
jgi:MinD superfamily P-loop ATPase